LIVRFVTAALLAALAVVPAVRPVSAQSTRLEMVVVVAGGQHRALLRAGGLLVDDRDLRDALGSGLPVRFNYRVELWERAVLDRLVGAEEVMLGLVQDPLDRNYLLTTGRAARPLATLAEAEQAILRAMPGGPRPPARGRRYYYLATLEVETLSLTDLEELQRWLRGEARPAIEGRRPVGRAVGRGLQRALVRMVGLPSRRYQVRSPTFES
jgi:hypothetical protein